MFIFDWVAANWAEIMGAFGAGYAFALAVVKLTPTKKDDEILETVAEKASFFKNLFGPKPKEPTPESEKPT